MDKLAAQIVAQGGRAIALASDITHDQSMSRAVSAAQAALGKVDLLFNRAGGSQRGDTAEDRVDLSLWKRTMQFDLNGTMLACRHAISATVAAGSGTVVNMSSGAGLRGSFAGHAYTAAKGAVIALTRALAAEYAPHGVRVNAICAGRIRTERILLNQDAGRATTTEMAARYPWRKGVP